MEKEYQTVNQIEVNFIEGTELAKHYRMKTPDFDNWMKGQQNNIVDALVM